MDNAVLETEVRDKSVKAKNLRRAERIPCEYYGHGVENCSLTIDYQTFRKLFRTSGENSIIDLKMEGGDKKVLVHRIDYNPVSDDIEYVEFINVRMDEEVVTHIHIKLEGLAPAVKELAGILMHNLTELEIRCLPGDLITEVRVNVDSLDDFQKAIHVSDIVVPDSITVLTDMDTTVATVAPPREEEVEEVPEMDVDSVAVEGEEAAEGEGGEEEEGEKKEEGGDE